MQNNVRSDAVFDKTTNSWMIPSQRRSNGTWTKPLRVKPGYTPEIEKKRYVPPAVKRAEEKKNTIPGLTFVNDPSVNVQKTTKRKSKLANEHILNTDKLKYTDKRSTCMASNSLTKQINRDEELVQQKIRQSDLACQISCDEMGISFQRNASLNTSTSNKFNNIFDTMKIDEECTHVGTPIKNEFTSSNIEENRSKESSHTKIDNGINTSNKINSTYDDKNIIEDSIIDRLRKLTMAGNTAEKL